MNSVRICFDMFKTSRTESKMIKLRWALFETYTIIQSITSSEMCSLHLTHPSAHTLGAVGNRRCSSWGFGDLLKGLTSVVDNSCRSRDSNPQPRVTSLTLYPLEPRQLCGGSLCTLQWWSFSSAERIKRLGSPLLRSMLCGERRTGPKFTWWE